MGRASPGRLAGDWTPTGLRETWFAHPYKGGDKAHVGLLCGSFAVMGATQCRP